MKSTPVPAWCLCCPHGVLKSGTPSTGCFAQARTPGEMEPREEQNSLTLQTCDRQERWGMIGALEVQGRRNVVAGSAEMERKVACQVTIQH